MAPVSEFRTWIMILIITHIRLAEFKRAEHKPKVVAEDFSKTDSDNLYEKSNWKPWSSWSICSRTCDGGATFRYRECKKHGQCVGEKVQYKLCNTKPCPKGLPDFRAQQCAAYDKIPTKGEFHHWLPHIDSAKPCVLNCRSKETGFIKEMAPQALDGTRCREGTLDMCVNGQCMTVGCDLKLGSTAKLDDCGVCGGDGSSCGQGSGYVWKETDFLTCSKSCGGGHQSTDAVCIDTKSGATVDPSNCDPETRPAVRVRECNKQHCQSRLRPSPFNHAHTQWSSDPWGPCTEECNGGLQARKVFCLQVFPNGTKQVTGDFHCTKHTQPATSRRCNNYPCPQWQTSSWSDCSVTCGRGTQTRTVKCIDHKGYDSDACDKSRKPSERKVCKLQAYCPDVPPGMKAEERPSSEQALPFIAPPPIWNGYEMENALKFEDTPMFAIGPWSDCSVSCGHGYRTRNVECKLFVKFSGKLVQLPDSECSDPRPVEREPCSKRPCPDANTTSATFMGETGEKETDPATGVEVTYSWHYEGYTACSRTCLGGTRHAIVRCFRDHDQSAVDDKYCRNAKRPPELKQVCNDIPCPPRWNTSDFTTCSQTCGGGTQTRTVQCVQELGSSPGDALIMPNDACPYPPPRTQVLCSTIDCPAQWDVAPWSTCSRACGKGIMERSVICRQRTATGDVRDLLEPNGICPNPKPIAMKSCFLGECPAQSTFAYSAKPFTPSKPVTISVTRGKGKANKLKVGGSAVLFEGTDVRLKCPVMIIDGKRPPVTWLKDGKPVVYSKTFNGHIKMSQLGAVKIKSLKKSDAGTYTCISGPVKEAIHLTVLPPKTTKPVKQYTPRATSFQPLFVAKTSNATQKFYANSTDALRILQTVSQKTTPFSNIISKWDTETTPDRLKYYADQSTPVVTPEPEEIYEKDLRHTVRVVLDMFDSELGTEFESIEDETFPDKSRVEVRSKTSDHIVTFEWHTGEWSACSKSCGGGGSQVRSVECRVSLDGEMQPAKNILCLNAGLTSPPESSQSCGLAECPEWQTGSWESCEASECFSLNTAIQKRNITCSLTDGSTLPMENCPAETKPRDRRDCVNNKCTAVWVTGPWSDCSVSCGMQGFQSRILKCVWYGTTQPAGNACRSLERPAIKQQCESLPACSEESSCRDHFKYCDYAKSLKLCRQKAYRSRCCRTCSAHYNL